MWHSRDEDGLQSQRLGVQIQVSPGGLGWVRDRELGVNRVRDRDRGVNRVRNWDRVRGGGERVSRFEKHSPPQKKKVEKSPI